MPETTDVTLEDQVAQLVQEDEATRRRAALTELFVRYDWRTRRIDDQIRSLQGLRSELRRYAEGTLDGDGSANYHLREALDRLDEKAKA